MAGKREFGPKDVEFCRIWEESDSLAQFCARTKMKVGAAQGRASTYRTVHKVDLKKFPRGGGGGQKLDIAAMRAVIKQVRDAKAAKEKAETEQAKQAETTS